MKISHAWLQEYFKDTLPTAEALAELFTFHSFEIEGVEEMGKAPHLDKIIDAKILPDRAHFCLSYQGIADEVQVLTGLQRVESVDKKLPDVDDSLAPVSVSVEATDFCRRYVSRRINNVSVKESPEKIQELLVSVGSRSINTVVDATNLAMFDIGQPLHAFDADKVKGVIVVRSARSEEKIVLLDGREITLSSEDSVIADDEGPLAIAGVKGGKRAEVTMDTKNIILESANFHPVSVRKTSTAYDLRNESSKRFENEITPEYALQGMNHVSVLIEKLSPGAIFGPVSDFYPHPAMQTTIIIDPSFINEKLGIDIPKEEVVRILKALKIQVEEKGAELSLTIPFDRFDLVIKEDVVEEIGRIYGYDKVKGILPPQAESLKVHEGFYVTERIKSLLAEQGFSEGYLYAFTSKGDIEVSYPLASDKKALRTNLSEGMAKALEMNARNADLLFMDSIKMFEMGKVFSEKNGEIKEHTSLCVGIKRIKKVKGQTANEDIRQFREYLLEKLGANVQTVCTIDDTGGLMMLKDIETGKSRQIGTINNIDGIMELDLDALIPHVEVPTYQALGFGPAEKVSYSPFSSYPFIVRDIALFVPETVTPEEIQSILTENGTDLLVAQRLFDTFTKEGKTSYAFRMIFQSYERTLTDEEVNKIMEAIAEKMKEKGWEVR
jgi:phenylalanyl-tRNA synthetase beta chain